MRIINSESILVTLEQLLSKSRFLHSLRVAQEAKKIALHYNLDDQAAYYGALVHDCAKDISVTDTLYNFSDQDRQLYQDFPAIWHAFVVDKVAAIHFSELPVEWVVPAQWHTTGKKDMSPLEKIIFISDFIEPERRHAERDSIHDLAYTSLDKAVFQVAYQKLKYLLAKQEAVFPKLLDCYNFYL